MDTADCDDQKAADTIAIPEPVTLPEYGPMTMPDAAKAPELIATVMSPMGISDTRSSRARRWNRLDSITVRNFKATEEATISLGDVTILVGPNGSGKSSVLQAIHWAARAPATIHSKSTSW